MISELKLGLNSMGDDDEKVTTGFDTDKMAKGLNDIIT